MKKNILKNLDIKQLTKYYIYANTPPYLYKHFRENQSVKDLSDACTTDELSKSLEELARSKQNNLEDFVAIYAIILALSYKPYSEIKAVLGRIENYEIDWKEDLLRIIEADSTQDIFSTYQIESNPESEVIEADESDASILNTYVVAETKAELKEL